MHGKHSNKEKPSNLEDGRSEVNNTVVLHGPAPITNICDMLYISHGKKTLIVQAHPLKKNSKKIIDNHFE
jgi:hypothetical protein